MSSDLISRKALLEKATMHGRCLHPPVTAYHMCVDVEDIENAPAVDAVILPCRIGDTVWTIRRFHSHLIPQKSTVSEMYFTRDMKLHITVKYIGRGIWGEKVFATREEAEAALRKEEENAAD